MLINRISLKKARNKISVEETSYMTLPPQNLKFHRLDSFAYQPALVGAMTAMKQAYQRNLLNLWMKAYSKLVVLAFSSSSLVYWRLRKR